MVVERFARQSIQLVDTGKRLQQRLVVHRRFLLADKPALQQLLRETVNGTGGGQLLFGHGKVYIPETEGIIEHILPKCTTGIATASLGLTEG